MFIECNQMYHCREHNRLAAAIKNGPNPPKKSWPQARKDESIFQRARWVVQLVLKIKHLS